MPTLQVQVSLLLVERETDKYTVFYDEHQKTYLIQIKANDLLLGTEKAIYDVISNDHVIAFSTHKPGTFRYIDQPHWHAYLLDSLTWVTKNQSSDPWKGRFVRLFENYIELWDKTGVYAYTYTTRKRKRLKN